MVSASSFGIVISSEYGTALTNSSTLLICSSNCSRLSARWREANKIEPIKFLAFNAAALLMLTITSFATLSTAGFNHFGRASSASCFQSGKCWFK